MKKKGLVSHMMGAQIQRSVDHEVHKEKKDEE